MVFLPQLVALRQQKKVKIQGTEAMHQLFVLISFKILNTENNYICSTYAMY